MINETTEHIVTALLRLMVNDQTRSELKKLNVWPMSRASHHLNKCIQIICYIC
jgi:hypothetical protein